MAVIDYRAAAAAAAKKYGYDPGYFTRQIGAESNFNPNAHSPAGAQGIAQIMPGTARGWGVNPRDPLASLDAAAKAMSGYLRSYHGDYRKALAAYNAGPGAVAKYGGVPPYAETQNYVNKILGNSQPTSVAPTVSSPSINSNGGSSADFKSSLLGAVVNRQPEQSLTSAVRDQLLTNHLTTRDLQGGAGAASRMVETLGAVADPQVAVRYAKKQLGTPYSWGGGSPSGPTFGIGRGSGTRGFDCSSLLQAAWAAQGVKIPRTTYGQIKTGRAVKGIGNAIPGDLLFPSAGHVQMYIGNGKVIEAPYTGGHVQIVPVRSQYIAIRRPGGK